MSSCTLTGSLLFAVARWQSEIALSASGNCDSGDWRDYGDSRNSEFAMESVFDARQVLRLSQLFANAPVIAAEKNPRIAVCDFFRFFSS
jgi:hypothetical protein